MAIPLGNLTALQMQQLAQAQQRWGNPLGAQAHGGYRQASQTFQGYSPYASNPGNYGTLAAQQARYAALAQAAAGIAGVAAGPPYPEPIEDAGIRAGEVIAWRCWLVHKGFLRSVYTQAIWAPSEPMEGDTKTNGVHAWKSLSKALEYGLEHQTVIFGQVELWGDVVEHERGYRAEFASIKSLDGILEGNRETLEAMRKLYSVGGRDDLVVERPKDDDRIAAALEEIRREIPGWDSVRNEVAKHAMEHFGYTADQLGRLTDVTKALAIYHHWNLMKDHSRLTAAARYEPVVKLTFEPKPEPEPTVGSFADAAWTIGVVLCFFVLPMAVIGLIRHFA